MSTIPARPRRLAAAVTLTAALATGALLSGGTVAHAQVVPPAAAEPDPNLDTDGDGLRDVWETEGFDADGDGEVDIDLPALGADPQKKDVFVEMDYMVVPEKTVTNDDGTETVTPERRLMPAAAELDQIVAAYAAVPVANPDGTQGITLHLDGGAAAGGDYDLGGGNEVAYRANMAGGIADVRALRASDFSATRNSVFRYMVWADSYGGGGSSGLAENNGDDFTVTVGPTHWGAGDVSSRVGTFIHELGHNLNLKHGGNDQVNWKPNYLSVMNYAFQLSGVPKGDGTFGWTFSTEALPDLDETELSETAGIPEATADFGTRFYDEDGTFTNVRLGGAIDWTGDGEINEDPVSVDINNDDRLTVLEGANDLDELRLPGGLVGQAPAAIQPRSAAPQSVTENELTADDARRMFGNDLRP